MQVIVNPLFLFVGSIIVITNSKQNHILVSKVVIINIAVVTGSSFNPIQGGYSPSVRLNYSTPSDEQIIEGVKRLASVL